MYPPRRRVSSGRFVHCSTVVPFTSENITKFLVVYLSSVILARFQDVGGCFRSQWGDSRYVFGGKPFEAGRPILSLRRKYC